MMYHMVNGICECAQRTSSLRMCNTLNEMMNNTYTHPNLFENVRDICQDDRVKLYNTELAISKLYGHVWTT